MLGILGCYRYSTVAVFIFLKQKHSTAGGQRGDLNILAQQTPHRIHASGVHGRQSRCSLHSKRTSGLFSRMARRWQRDREGAALWALFQSGVADPQINDTTFIHTVQADHPNEFGHISNRNFTNNYRRLSAIYITAMEQQGARRRGGAPNPGRGAPNPGRGAAAGAGPAPSSNAYGRR